jgi:hypothetical protein
MFIFSTKLLLCLRHFQPQFFQRSRVGLGVVRFTGDQHACDVGVIVMNERLYDRELTCLMQADS